MVLALPGLGFDLCATRRANKVRRASQGTVTTTSTGNRFRFVRDRVVASKYSNAGELLIKAGLVQEIEYRETSQELRIACENALLVVAKGEIKEYDVEKRKRILINCIDCAIRIEGDGAEVEIDSLASLLDSRVRDKRSKPKKASTTADKSGDVLGYYRLIGVGPGCSKDEIKRAYKRKCLEVHPDVNSSSDAHESFLKLRTAYEILSDAQKRADYDAKCVSVPEPTEKSTKAGAGQTSNFDPIRCSRCKCVTAQPRYVVFWETFSFLSTVRSPVQGVMCTKCAGDAAYEATKKSLLFGWWGIWGLLLTPASVFTNLSGGEKPPENNGRILLHQSWYFVQTNKPELAFILASEAASYLRSSTSKDKESLLSICNVIIDECRQYGEGKSLTDVWNRALPRRGDQWKAVGACAIAWAVVAGLMGGYMADKERRAKEGAPEYTYQQEPRGSKEIPPPAEIDSRTPKEIPIPQTYLPLATGYLPGKQIRDDGGRSEVVLKNNSGYNFHVRLYRRVQGSWEISRELYLKAYEEFKMEGLESGEYEIRRMDVQTKQASKTEAFTLEEKRVENGINYTIMTITLNATQGNSRITPISAKEF